MQQDGSVGLTRSSSFCQRLADLGAHVTQQAGSHVSFVRATALAKQFPASTGF